MALRYEIDELLNESIMTGSPSIIVEGIDDITIYGKITKTLPFDVEIFAVECIEGFNQGCEEVINAITELNKLPASTYNLEEHVLGIIDKDVRDFRKELPTCQPLLILNSYSIESHLVSAYIIEKVLSTCTKASRELVTEDLAKMTMAQMEIKLLDLYYISLEALKGSTQKGYNSDFSYSFTPGRLKDENAKNKVMTKKADLDSFAQSLGLNKNLSTLKSITKGKWLIDYFCEELLTFINSLPDLCQNKRVPACKACMTQAYEKCLYRLQDGISKNTLKTLATANAGGEEIDYIKDRIKSMKI